MNTFLDHTCIKRVSLSYFCYITKHILQPPAMPILLQIKMKRYCFDYENEIWQLL